VTSRRDGALVYERPEERPAPITTNQRAGRYTTSPPSADRGTVVSAFDLSPAQIRNRRILLARRTLRRHWQRTSNCPVRAERPDDLAWRQHRNADSTKNGRG
jgi:hypothetical protein